MHDDRDREGLVVGDLDGEGPDVATDAKRGSSSPSPPREELALFILGAIH